MNAARALGVVLLGLVSGGCQTSRPPPSLPPDPPPAVVQVPSPAPVAVKPVVPVPADPPPPDKPAPIEPSPDLDQALKYANFLRGLSAAELRREHDAARLAFAQLPSELNRVRYALVVAQAPVPLKDERRALELLEPFAKNPRTDYAPLRSFALVLHTFLREQVRLGTNAQALKDKLDALMSLEKSLAERERAAPGGGR